MYVSYMRMRHILVTCADDFCRPYGYQTTNDPKAHTVSQGGQPSQATLSVKFASHLPAPGHGDIGPVAGKRKCTHPGCGNEAKTNCSTCFHGECIAVYYKSTIDMRQTSDEVLAERIAESFGAWTIYR